LIGIGLSSVLNDYGTGAANLFMFRAVIDGTFGLKNTFELAKKSF
jgi:hypothetical protein